MKIREIIGLDATKLATAKLKVKSKRSQQQAAEAQTTVQNRIPKPQPQPSMPVQRTNGNQATIQPGIVKQQNRIDNLVKQIAVSNNQPQPATDDETALAFAKYCQLKKQADNNYAERLRQQLAQTEVSTK